LFLAHVGIWLLMGVIFTQFMYTYIFWAPWSALAIFGRKRLADE
jgi:hypothetical protein